MSQGSYYLNHFTFQVDELIGWLELNPFPPIETYQNLERRNTLAIDLDRTLIWINKETGAYMIRKHAKSFLLQMKQCYKQVVLYTASMSPHATRCEEILSDHCQEPKLFDQVISKEGFRHYEGGWSDEGLYKDLTVIEGVDTETLSDVLLLDDWISHVHKDQLDNFLHIPEIDYKIYGQDDMLKVMSVLLVHLSQRENVRSEIGRLNRIWLDKGALKHFNPENDSIDRLFRG